VQLAFNKKNELIFNFKAGVSSFITLEPLKTSAAMTDSVCYTLGDYFHASLRSMGLMRIWKRHKCQLENQWILDEKLTGSTWSLCLMQEVISQKYNNRTCRRNSFMTMIKQPYLKSEG
jgi:hypothetical protein